MRSASGSGVGSTPKRAVNGQSDQRDVADCAEAGELPQRNPGARRTSSPATMTTVPIDHPIRRDKP